VRPSSGARRVAGALLVLAAYACGPRTDAGGERHFHHDAGIGFDYPAAWSVHDAIASFTGGSVLAVLGTVPVPTRCGTAHVDINCYYEQKLPPGTISVVVGTGSFGGATLFDARTPDPHEIDRERVEVGGAPGVVHHYRPGDFYGEDQAIGWEIAFPRSVLEAFVIQVRLRGPGLAELQRQLDGMIASVRVDGLGPPLHVVPEAAEAAVHTALAELDGSMRRRHVARPEHVTWYSCFAPQADVTVRRVISLGPDGPLETLQAVDCRWTAAPEGTHFWRVTLELDGRPRETLWLTSDGRVAGSRRE
jgi:hypothetical protein